jgi:hypothetical protein
MAKPTIADRLSAARGEFDATNRQRMELEAKRNAALIADDDRTATKLAGQLDELRLLARGHEDKIKLLEAAAEEEANARRVKEKAALIGRIEARLAERNKVAAELAEMLPQANNLFRRLLELNRAIDSSWPWPGSAFLGASRRILGCWSCPKPSLRWSMCCAARASTRATSCAARPCLLRPRQR